MDIHKSTESRSSGAVELKGSITVRESVALDKTGFNSKIEDIRAKISELQSGSFLDQIKSIEYQATYYSNRSSVLEEKLSFLAFELERLNLVNENLEKDLKAATGKVEQNKAEFTTEITSWRNKFTEKDGLLSKLQIDTSDTIKKLTREKADLLAKLGEKEAFETEISNKNRSLADEIRNLKSTLTTSEETVTVHTRKITQMESAFNDQLSLLKQEHETNLANLEATHKAQLEAIRRELTDARNKEMEREKSRANDEMKTQIIEKDETITKITEELKTFRSQSSSLQTEIDRLNTAYGAMKIALEAKDAAMVQREDDFALKQAELERLFGDQKIAYGETIEEEWKSKVELLKTQMDIELKTHRKKLIDAENTASFLTKEKAFLERTVNDLRVENERLKSEASQMREEYELEFEQMTQQIDTFRTTFIDPKDLEVRFKAERSSYETQIAQLNLKLEEFSGQVFFLNEDNKRLNNQSIERLRDIETFKQKLGSAADASEVEELTRKVSELKIELDEASEKILKITNERNQQTAKAKGLESEIEILRAEIEDLKKFVAGKREEVRSLEETISKLRRANNEALQEKNRLTGDFMTIKEKNDTFMSNYESLIAERDHFRAAYEKVDVEHSLANKQLLNKIAEIDELKAKYYDALQTFQRESVVTTTTVTKKVTNVSQSSELKEDFANL